MFRKIWAVLLGLSSVVWPINAVQVVTDNNYHIDKFSLFVAFLITAGVVWMWAVEEWNA